MRQELTLQVFFEQMQKLRTLGPMQKMLLSRIPGMSEILQDEGMAQREFDRAAAMMQAMTPEEREHPELLDATSKTRIAADAGATVEDVDTLLARFEQAKELLRKFM